MTAIRSVAVFCGSSPGHDPVHLRSAVEFGQALARADMRLVYGGGRVGLMGALADAALAAGGDVVGVIPDFLRRREVAHEGVADTRVTDSMHSRKREMFDLADAFVSLPGGLGTYDETIEIITWRQLGLHDKPILLCDVAGAFQPLLGAIEAAIVAGFARPSARALYETVPDVAATIARLAHLAAAGPGTPARL